MKKRQLIKVCLGTGLTLSLLYALQPWIQSDVTGHSMDRLLGDRAHMNHADDNPAETWKRSQGQKTRSEGQQKRPEEQRKRSEEQQKRSEEQQKRSEKGPGSSESDVSLVEKVGKRFQHRKQLLQQACRTYGNSSLIRPNKPTSFVPMPLYKPYINADVHYCAIAKTACTTWTAFFAAIREYMKVHNVTAIKDKKKADHDIYFTFVREPYARLWSGYVDKLLTPNEVFWRITGRYTVNNFRQHASLKSQKCGHDVTFPEFIRYVIHSQETGQHRNDHFIPTHDHCDLCGVPYQYIGHLETMSEDMPFITQAMGSPISYTRSYDSDTIVQNANMVFWAKRMVQVLKCMDKGEAGRRLWKKYQIRGLISKHESFPFSKRKASNMTVEQFIKKALEAHERSKKDPGLKAQRTESLREAFSLVPLQDKLRIQQTLFLDFQMFGFDPFLEDVFPKEPYVKDKHFSYLNIN